MELEKRTKPSHEIKEREESQDRRSARTGSFRRAFFRLDFWKARSHYDQAVQLTILIRELMKSRSHLNGREGGEERRPLTSRISS